MKAIILPASTCEIPHYCVICGDLALFAPHSTRGRTYKCENVRSDCPGDFKIRCAKCRFEGKQPAGFRMACDVDLEKDGYLTAEKWDAERAERELVFDVI